MTGGTALDEQWARLQELERLEEECRPGYVGDSSTGVSSSSIGQYSSPYNAHQYSSHLIPRQVPTPNYYSSFSSSSKPSSYQQSAAVKSDTQFIQTPYEDRLTASGGPSYSLQFSIPSKRVEIKTDPNLQDEFDSEGEDSWMNNVNLDDIVKSEVRAEAEVRGAKVERREENGAATLNRLENGAAFQTPEAIKKRQLEQAKLEERRRNDMVQPPPVVNGVTLRRKADLGSDVLVAALSFKGDFFNAVQSKVFDVAFESDENLVVSSPTGSGKTTIFDLAFFRMLQNKETGTEPYAIYFAPTKALCGERTRDWRQRFSQVGVKCSEVTGDTTSVYTVMKSIAESDLIITTPEKWESVTRRSDQLAARSAPALIMIDEVHFLRDTRGATLEVVISRMKAHGPSTRFVALSATVPNIDDIARWLAPAEQEHEAPLQGVYEGAGDLPTINDEEEPKEVAIKDMPKAKVYQFGEEYRPVKLEKIVRGFAGPNEWVLNKRLESELYPMIHRHTEGKPVLAFCSTRRACQATAFEIAKRYKTDLDAGRKVPWKLKQDPQNLQRPRFRDQKLADMAAQGVAFHHAGLDPEDRLKVEQMYLKGEIMMIASTSTLAVGVNLPAHTVIIMGTAAWHGPVAGFQEYSDIDVQQMMGRAGRPQFDKSGICIVMCDKTKEAKYKDLVNSRTIVESSLHTSLVEHLNTEIGLGTITSLESARKWLRSSFLYIRIQQNARHYAASVARKKRQSWKESLDHHVEEAVLKLETKELVEWVLPGGEDPKDGYESDDSMSSTDSRRAEKPAKELRLTEYGKVMSSHVIRFETMCSILKVDADATVRRLLQTLAGAAEFSDLRVRPGEQQVLNLLKRHPEVRYPTDETETYADKVFLHLQACFANITFDDLKKASDATSMMGTQMAIFKDAPRVAKAIATVCRLRNYGRATKNALEVLHAVNGKAWEDSAVVFRQIESIGPKSIGKLEQNDIRSFDELLKTPTLSIESWLGRSRVDARRAGSTPDFGHKVHEIVRSLPRYRLTLKKEEMVKEAGHYPYITLRVTLDTKDDWKSRRHVKNLDGDEKGPRGKKYGKTTYNLTILIIRNDGHCFDMRHTSAWTFSEKMSSFLVDCELKDSEHKIEVYAGVDELSGCSSSAIYDPKLDEELFEDVREEEEEEEVEFTPEVVEVDDVSDLEDLELQARKKVKTAGKATICGDGGQHPSTRPKLLPLRSVESKVRSDVGGSIRKSDYQEAIAAAAKPRSRMLGSSSSDKVSNTRVLPRKTKKKPLFLPGTSSTGNPYIDDEAVESDGEEAESYDEDDLAFIDDRDEVLAELERPSVDRPSTKPIQRIRLSRSNSLVLEEYIPKASAGKRSELSSDDFDGIESVEDELNEEVRDGKKKQVSPQPADPDFHQRRDCAASYDQPEDACDRSNYPSLDDTPQFEPEGVQGPTYTQVPSPKVSYKPHGENINTEDLGEVDRDDDFNAVQIAHKPSDDGTDSVYNDGELGENDMYRGADGRLMSSVDDLTDSDTSSAPRPATPPRIPNNHLSVVDLDEGYSDSLCELDHHSGDRPSSSATRFDVEYEHDQYTDDEDISPRQWTDRAMERDVYPRARHQAYNDGSSGSSWTGPLRAHQDDQAMYYTDAVPQSHDYAEEPNSYYSEDDLVVRPASRTPRYEDHSPFSVTRSGRPRHPAPSSEHRGQHTSASHLPSSQNGYHDQDLDRYPQSQAGPSRPKDVFRSTSPAKKGSYYGFGPRYVDDYGLMKSPSSEQGGSEAGSG